VEEQLGADLETLDSKKAGQYGIDGGVVVKSIKRGGPVSKTRMEEGFIITSVNGVDVRKCRRVGPSLTKCKRNS
jgi:S1-C subfamily serine protease